MENIKFNSLKELYERLTPALITKSHDVLRNTKINVSKDDIWNYLRYNYWNKKSKISLGEMVDDILSTPDDELINYINKR